MKKTLILLGCIMLAACTTQPPRDLERAEPSPELAASFHAMQDSIVASFTEPIDYMKLLNFHSIMVVKDGKVVLEKWFGKFAPEQPHTMFSVSKTFTAAAVGMVIADGKLSLKDRVDKFFPDKVRPDNPCNATVEDLLMMAGGHDTDPSLGILQFDITAMTTSVKEGTDIAAAFFSHPFVHEPGTHFCYNSLGTYLLSAIVTKLTGESVLDYLTPRLFEPLGIDIPEWDADENGVSLGGWGLHLKTEDMAKMGQLLLQKGRWGSKQLIPAEWVENMGASHIDCAPATLSPEEADAKLDPARNDWRQGYGFQTWRNKVEGFRADGAGGQFILVLPEKNAVVAVTAWLSDTQAEMDLIWDYIYPCL